jgi:hypothetical protein
MPQRVLARMHEKEMGGKGDFLSPASPFILAHLFLKDNLARMKGMHRMNSGL